MCDCGKEKKLMQNTKYGVSAGTEVRPARRKINKRRGFIWEVKKNWILFLMLVPAMLFFLFNNYLPLVGLWYAFTNFDYAGGLFGSAYIGFKNFDFLVGSGKLIKLTFNTVAYNLVFIFLGHALQIAFAVMISQVAGKHLKKLAQSIMFLPYFVSFVVLNAVVYAVFNYDVGFLNNIREALNMEPFDAYNTPFIWPFVLVALNIWKGLGYGMVVYLASITGISNDFYEAARIDGADIFQQIRYITVPLLMPTCVMLIMFSLGGIIHGQFSLFYQVIGNNGVLFGVTDIIDTYVYRSLTQTYDVGLGTAASLYQSVVGFVIIMTVNTIVRKAQPDYSLF